ncbi:MAG: hypothetical protein K6T49_08950, partial [Acidobacterium ailaaui]|nr:hypothetical protein [Pseudacidobacterium ailaaui]
MMTIMKIVARVFTPVFLAEFYPEVAGDLVGLHNCGLVCPSLCGTALCAPSAICRKPANRRMPTIVRNARGKPL